MKKEKLIFLKNGKKIASCRYSWNNDEIAKSIAEHTDKYDTIKWKTDFGMTLGLIYNKENKEFYNDDEPE